MSAPERPTLVKRKAIFAASAAMRRSQAEAITAPAPATVPLSAPTIGRRQRDHREDQGAGVAGEVEQPTGVALEQLADDLLDVAARAEGATGAGEQDRAHPRLVSSASKASRSSS